MSSSDDMQESTRLAGVLAHTTDAVVTLRPDGAVLAWNRAATGLLGLSEKAACGADISDLLQGAGNDLAEALARAVDGETVEELELHIADAGGWQLSVAATVVPFGGSDGTVAGQTLILHDLTPRRAAERTDALLAAVVSSSDDAIVSKSLEGIITSWNAGAEALLGYTAEEAVGRHISMIAAPGRESEMPAILARIASGEQVEHFDTQRRRKDGHIVDVSLTVSPVRDRAGRIIGASKIARDVSERKRNEERTRLLLSELDHRTKNMLAAVQSILRLTRASTIGDFISAVEGRVQALALVHTEVARNQWDGAYLDDLVRLNLRPLLNDRSRIGEGPRIFFGPQAAESVGILLHELGTNAARHGALSAKQGRVEADWALTEGGDVVLQWSERGGHGVAAPSRQGFGMRVIEGILRDQVGGQASLTWSGDGLRATFTIPGDALAPPPPILNQTVREDLLYEQETVEDPLSSFGKDRSKRRPAGLT